MIKQDQEELRAQHARLKTTLEPLIVEHGPLHVLQVINDYMRAQAEALKLRQEIRAARDARVVAAAVADALFTIERQLPPIEEQP